MKKTQIFGALLVGLLSVIAQIAVFYVRFGKFLGKEMIIGSYARYDG